jgi:biotin carboxylase
MPNNQPTLLALSSYFKGERFLRACRPLGVRLILLTTEKLLNEPWPRDAIDEVFALPDFKDRRAVLNAVAFLCHSRSIRWVTSLDDFDVELGAHIREHLRLPGTNESTARFYRDKLAMRVRALESGILVPRFTGVFNDAEVRRFLDSTPPPWLLKPRGSASAMGIQKHADVPTILNAIAELGDERSFYVLEEMLPGEMYHVDSLLINGHGAFAEANKYFKPLWDVWHGGGVYASRTLPRQSDEAQELRRLNQKVHTSFGLVNGPSHTEFLRHSETGQFYFIETAARVGGANIMEMVEAATGINLWEEWARLEILGSSQYRLPHSRQDYGGVTVSLARDERPDYSSFTDPEIFYRLDKPNHIGLVIRCPTPERTEELLSDYMRRIERDHLAVLPPVSEM